VLLAFFFFFNPVQILQVAVRDKLFFSFYRKFTGSKVIVNHWAATLSGNFKMISHSPGIIKSLKIILGVDSTDRERKGKLHAYASNFSLFGI